MFAGAAGIAMMNLVSHLSTALAYGGSGGPGDFNGGMLPCRMLRDTLKLLVRMAVMICLKTSPDRHCNALGAMGHLAG